MRRSNLEIKEEILDCSRSCFFDQTLCYKTCTKGVKWTYTKKFFVGNHLYETEQVKNKRVTYSLIKDSKKPLKRFDWFYEVENEKNGLFSTR